MRGFYNRDKSGQPRPLRNAALLCAHCLDSGWLRRLPGSRALQVTPQGAVALRGWLGLARWHEVVGPGAA